MKKTLPILIALLVMVLAACSSATSTATQPPALEPTATQPGATQGIPQTGDGTQVDIKLADNTINASMTTFQVGVPYTFVITNTGRHAHNFNINPPVSAVGSLDEALNKALLAVPQDQLGPGQSTTVEFKFPDAAAGQQLEFSCLIRRHYEDGMKVSITVIK
jgi:uncharacterized cupredoxin-like copper-binding protein